MIAKQAGYKFLAGNRIRIGKRVFGYSNSIVIITTVIALLNVIKTGKLVAFLVKT